MKQFPHSTLKMTGTLFTRDSMFHDEEGHVTSHSVLRSLDHTPEFYGSWFEAGLSRNS